MTLKLIYININGSTEETIKNGQSRETGNKTKKKKNRTQYVLGTTIGNQTQIT